MATTERERLEDALLRRDAAALALILAESGRAPSVHLAHRLAGQRYAEQPAVLFDLGRALAERPEQLAKGLGATLLGGQYAGHEAEVRLLLLRLADDADWVAREYAADGLGRLLTDHFDATYDLFAMWTQHPSENIRRAVALATMPAARGGNAERAARCLALLEPLLADRSVYVRKNLGPFAIGSALLVHHPDSTFEALECWRERFADEQVRWNLAMACSASGGARWAERSFAFLYTLADDPRPFVWRAVSTALVNLGRKRPEVAQREIRRWLEDPARRQVAERALGMI